MLGFSAGPRIPAENRHFSGNGAAAPAQYRDDPDAACERKPQPVLPAVAIIDAPRLPLFQSYQSGLRLSCVNGMYRIVMS
jgi:hypothetical protein